ncbi:MAG: NUDIX hydrolase [Deltaproteobacteria bacterium]|nr:NUDIX hydrolase [Deltaproteobacteria bacterium]
MDHADIKTERRLSAGGVIFRLMDKSPEVALISVKGGKVWGLPKGAIDQGESMARTAHREVREETGLDGKILEKIGHIEYFFSYKEGEELRRVFKLVYFFLMEYTAGDVSGHDDEVVDCRWFPIDEAIKTLKYEDEKGILKQAKKMLKSLKYM